VVILFCHRLRDRHPGPADIVRSEAMPEYSTTFCKLGAGA
jgi:hypothetical protein